MARKSLRRQKLSSNRRGAIAKVLIFVVGALVIAWGIWANGSLFSKGVDRSDVLTAKVTRGRLKISIVERGNLNSANNVTIASKVEGTTKIISIVPEGTVVKKGDQLAELDSSALDDKLLTQKSALTKANSDMSLAQNNETIQKAQNESDINNAEIATQLADLDLEKYDKGDFVQEKETIEGEIKKAEEAHARALDKYNYSKELSNLGLITQNELEADRVALKSAQIDLNLAKRKLKVLVDYTQKREITNLTSLAKEAELELERVKLKADAALDQMESDVETAKLNLKTEQSKYRKLLDQIEACVLIAPIDGQIVYHQPAGRRSSEAVIEEGSTVYERQKIIDIPDLTQMQVEAKIHESRIGFVSNGMPVQVRVEARPGVVFNGRVVEVGQVPESTNWRQPDLREYKVVVQIVESVGKIQGLKPGLTAEVEILVAELEDTLKVPVQAVVLRNGKHFMFVATPGGIETRQVVVGDTNDIETAIEDLEETTRLLKDSKYPLGVKVGDEIVLAPRTTLRNEYKALEEAEPELTKEEGREGEFKANKGAGRGDKKGSGGRKNGGGGKKKGSSGPGGPRKAGGPGVAGGGSGGAGKTAGGAGGFNLDDMFKGLDKDSDGKITKAEATGGRWADRFDQVDSNKDDAIDKAEFKQAMEAMMKRFRSGGGTAGGAAGGGASE